MFKIIQKLLTTKMILEDSKNNLKKYIYIRTFKIIQKIVDDEDDLAGFKK